MAKKQVSWQKTGILAKNRYLGKKTAILGKVKTQELSNLKKKLVTKFLNAW